MASSDHASRIADEIIGRASIASAAAAASFRADLVKRLTRLWRLNLGKKRMISESARIIRRTVHAHSDVQLQIISDAHIASWAASAQQVLQRLPKEAIEAVAAATGPPPGIPAMDLLYPPGEGPKVRFPRLEQSVRDLQERQIVTPSEFYAVSDQADRDALFTVSGFEKPAIEKIQKALAETLDEGPSLRSFQKRMREAQIDSPLGPKHMETVFRLNTQKALRAGREKVLSHPIVATAFPYRQTTSIGDSRRTELCLEITGGPRHPGAGIGGSNIFRADDPVWIEIGDAPRHWGCRCNVQPLTIKEAARKGVEEAQQWLETGSDPRTGFVGFPKLSEEAQKTWDGWRKYRAAA